jgi:predicted N-acetyltransferase YhbS
MEKSDITIACKDCGADFVFTVGEQEFYEEKGFTNQPVRCKDCRNRKKDNRNFNSDDRREF